MIITGPVIIMDLQCRGFGSVAIEEQQCMAYVLPDLQWRIILDWKLNESVVLFLNLVFYHTGISCLESVQNTDIC